MSAVAIVMPKLSGATEEGTIVRWLKNVGDRVEIGDELVEVETDKATVISVGAAQPRALVDDDGVATSRPFATVTLACDHRAVYGADGAAFLARLRALLETPEVLVL